MFKLSRIALMHSFIGDRRSTSFPVMTEVMQGSQADHSRLCMMGVFQTGRHPHV
jgi:hypothetical protein